MDFKSKLLFSFFNNLEILKVYVFPEAKKLDVPKDTCLFYLVIVMLLKNVQKLLMIIICLVKV